MSSCGPFTMSPMCGGFSRAAEALLPDPAGHLRPGPQAGGGVRHPPLQPPQEAGRADQERRAAARDHQAHVRHGAAGAGPPVRIAGAALRHAAHRRRRRASSAPHPQPLPAEISWHPRLAALRQHRKRRRKPLFLRGRRRRPRSGAGRARLRHPEAELDADHRLRCRRPSARRAEGDLARGNSPASLWSCASAARRRVRSSRRLALESGIELRPAIEAEGREAVREIVAAGGGIGFVSAAEFGQDSRLAPIPIEGREMLMDEALICLRERNAGKLVRAFFDVARADASREPRKG